MKNQQNTDKKDTQEKDDKSEKSHPSIQSVFQENKDVIIKILLLNAAMLAFGVLGEKKMISRKRAFLSGSAAFTSAFYLIYENFVNDLLINKQVFWFNFVLWSLYGVAYTFSYKDQNIAYNSRVLRSEKSIHFQEQNIAKHRERFACTRALINVCTGAQVHACTRALLHACTRPLVHLRLS